MFFKQIKMYSKTQKTIHFFVWSIYLLATLDSRADCSREFEEHGFYPQREHSLMKMYDTIMNWETSGDTIITPQYIRLTADEPRRSGGLWNKIPLNFPNWEVQFEFRITGRGRGLLHGDGIAFWYVRNPMPSGDVFGGADYFHGLGIFLDTYITRSHGYDHPNITAMVNNGTFSYETARYVVSHNDGKLNELAGCNANFRSADHRTALSVRYYHGVLMVRTDVDQRDVWTLCFATRVHLPVGLYLGLTASTGELSDNHDLIELKTYRLDWPPPTTRDDNSVIVVLPKNKAITSLPPLFLLQSFNFYMILIVLYTVCNFSKIYHL